METVNDGFTSPISTASLAEGDDVPIPTNPERPPGVNAMVGVVDVLNVIGEVVAK